MKTKKCIRCKKVLSINNFYRDKSRLSGYREVCKFCKKKEYKKFYKEFPEKATLNAIKSRCNYYKNKCYKNYGGRGIQCLITAEEIRKLMIRDDYWNMNYPTIDRKDNDGNYTYENCQFIEMSENSSKANRKIILQFDKAGNIIQEWSSIVVASKETKINYSNIRSCVQGHQKTAGGFIWKYKK